jgi:transketolase N-terminal domain/subunit
MISFGKKDHPLLPLSSELRLSILEMINTAGSGHIGGCFCCIVIFILIVIILFFPLVT